MAGVFTSSRYAATYGAGTNIHPIKIQPETLALSLGSPAVLNSPPTGAFNNQISAIVKGSKRKLGLTPRKITVKFGAAAPVGYLPNSAITLPWLTPFPASFARGTTGTYLGSPVTVASLTAETAK